MAFIFTTVKGYEFSPKPQELWEGGGGEREEGVKGGGRQVSCVFLRKEDS